MAQAVTFRTKHLPEPDRWLTVERLLDDWLLECSSFLPQESWELLQKAEAICKLEAPNGACSWLYRARAVDVLIHDGHSVALDSVRHDGKAAFFSRLLARMHPGYYAHCQWWLKRSQLCEKWVTIVHNGDDVAEWDVPTPQFSEGLSLEERERRTRESLPADARYSRDIKPVTSGGIALDRYGQTATHFVLVGYLEVSYEAFLPYVRLSCPRTPEREAALAALEAHDVRAAQLPPLDLPSVNTRQIASVSATRRQSDEDQGIHVNVIRNDGSTDFDALYRGLCDGTY